ncbi:hypothetical protein F5Y12DRAFT_705698 [Xylaria sp. FL1777]|nr:hypothetical protein F5Y12DRAFT_705698 [Xylaria sp. FL1777]
MTCYERTSQLTLFYHYFASCYSPNLPLLSPAGLFNRLWFRCALRSTFVAMSDLRSDVATQGSNEDTSETQHTEPAAMCEDRVEQYVGNGTILGNTLASGVESTSRVRSDEERGREYGSLFAAVSGWNNQQQNTNGTNGGSTNGGSTNDDSTSGGSTNGGS